MLYNIKLYCSVNFECIIIKIYSFLITFNTIIYTCYETSTRENVLFTRVRIIMLSLAEAN